VAGSEPEEQVTYIENALTFLMDEATGCVELGLRQDARVGLKSVDEKVDSQPEPECGWPEGTVMVEGRPVLPLRAAASAGRRTRRPSAASRPAVARVRQRGSSREHRSRRTRRAAGASRDGPSDPPEGDGEPPPPYLSQGAPRVERKPLSSSHDGEGFFGRWSATDHGIDTVSFALRPVSEAALRAFRERPTQRLTRRERGESFWLTQVVDGIRFGVWPQHRLIVAEGRLAPMLSGEPSDMRLAAPESLPLAAERTLAALASVGVEVDAEAVVRRLDPAAEVRFDDPADGLVALDAVGGLQLPGREQSRRASPQQTRSVSWSPGRNVSYRFYDAGDFHGTDPPGVRLRLERQVRYAKSAQRPVTFFTREAVAALYVGPLRGVVRDAPRLHLLGPSDAERYLIQQVREGRLSAAVAERLIGMVRLIALRVGPSIWSRDTHTRRNRELRDGGVALRAASENGAVGLSVPELLAALAAVWSVEDARA
jgi:hypothetical protein